MATRKLVSGAPRVLPNHTTPAGRCYLDAYKALEQRYGPFVDEVARMEASRTAFAWVELQASQLELVQAREKLATAKGRHSTAWNARAVQRLSKRQGLNDATYCQCHAPAGADHRQHPRGPPIVPNRAAQSGGAWRSVLVVELTRFRGRCTPFALGDDG